MKTQIEAIKGVIFDLDGTLVSSELNFSLIKAQVGCPAEQDLLDYIEQLPSPYMREEVHERSKNIDNRKSVGHWEGDLVSGSRNTHIATLVDRKSRFTIILKLAGKDAESVLVALLEAFKQMPAEYRKSLTWDRGMELAKHAELTKEIGIPVYFCDPQIGRAHV